MYLSVAAWGSCSGPKVLSVEAKKIAINGWFVEE
jgi:hypothetical protein